MKIVASCTNATDALKWLRENDCDVALVDIAMPGMSGIDLLKQIRKEEPGLPVLILSAYPEDQYAVRLIRAGAAGYLIHLLNALAPCHANGDRKSLYPLQKEQANTDIPSAH